MSHTSIRKRKTRIESLPLVCYRCGTNKKSRKCKQYGNNVWCLQCKNEVDGMSVNHNKGDDVPHPFAYGTANCLCKNGRLYQRCPIHKATYLAMKNREANEDAAKKTEGPNVMVHDKKAKTTTGIREERAHVQTQSSRSAG